MNDIISLAQYQDVHTMGFTSMREVEESEQSPGGGL